MCSIDTVGPCAADYSFDLSDATDELYRLLAVEFEALKPQFLHVYHKLCTSLPDQPAATGASQRRGRAGIGQVAHSACCAGQGKKKKKKKKKRKKKTNGAAQPAASGTSSGSGSVAGDDSKQQTPSVKVEDCLVVLPELIHDPDQVRVRRVC